MCVGASHVPGYVCVCASLSQPKAVIWQPISIRTAFHWEKSKTGGPTTIYQQSVVCMRVWFTRKPCMSVWYIWRLMPPTFHHIIPVCCCFWLSTQLHKLLNDILLHNVTVMLILLGTPDVCVCICVRLCVVCVRDRQTDRQRHREREREREMESLNCTTIKNSSGVLVRQVQFYNKTAPYKTIQASNRNFRHGLLR